MRESIKKFYGDETPKTDNESEERKRISFKNHTRARSEKMLNNGDIILNNSASIKANEFELHRSADKLNSSYDNMQFEQKPYVSGFFMKGPMPKGSLLDHVRLESRKMTDMSYSELAKRMVVPYKNDTRQRKLMFCEHSPTQPHTSMNQHYPSRRLLTAVSRLYGSKLPGVS